MATEAAKTAAPPEARPRVLVSDDQQDVTSALRMLLRGEGFEVQTVHAPDAALAAVREGPFDIALIDLNYTRDTTSGQEGLQLLDDLWAIDPNLPVVVMTAWSTVDLAMQAVRRGASDFVEKPWKNQRLLTILRNQVALGEAVADRKRMRADRQQQVADACEGLIAESPAMHQVLDIIHRVAESEANVLITGENGTGKTLIAREVHRLSHRADEAFVAVNMGGLADGVFESEMFGHLKGAFTDAQSERIGRIEMAHRGTLFLDEIGNLPMDQQRKLLHVIETGRVEPVGASVSRECDVRLVTATNANLKQLVAEGQFRKDLFFRLNTVEIHLPQLSERPEDIEPLARHFLDRHRERYRRPELRLAKSAMDLLRRYPWPGNVRELDHVIERAVLLTREKSIKATDLRLESDGGALAETLPLMSIEAAEEALIRTAITRFEGNVARAAEVLGLSRSALYRRMERYGLDR